MANSSPDLTSMTDVRFRFEARSQQEFADAGVVVFASGIDLFHLERDGLGGPGVTAEVDELISFFGAGRERNVLIGKRDRYRLAAVHTDFEILNAVVREIDRLGFCVAGNDPELIDVRGLGERQRDAFIGTAAFVRYPGGRLVEVGDVLNRISFSL